MLSFKQTCWFSCEAWSFVSIVDVEGSLIIESVFVPIGSDGEMPFISMRGEEILDDDGVDKDTGIFWNG